MKKDYQESISKLLQFNNCSFTKKQWNIILNGCNCPKSAAFWMIFKNNCEILDNNKYLLLNANEEKLQQIFQSYLEVSLSYTKKYQDKIKRKAKIEKWRNNYSHNTHILINGVLCIESSTYDFE